MDVRQVSKERNKASHNMGFSAMLPSEYILIDISLISCSSNFTNLTSFGIYHQLSIFDQQQYRADVTQNISTAESPGRWLRLFMNQSRKTLFFVLIAISCGLITFLLTKGYVTDLVIALALLALISLIGAITFAFIKKLRWLRVSKFTYFLAIMMTTWFVSYFHYWKDSFISKSTVEYVSEKLEAYKLETGHYPKTNSSNDLVDSLTININEYLPEMFSYHLDESGKFYVLKTYEGDKLYSVYDSRIKREIISEIRRE